MERANLFTGWMNVPLSPTGEQEALRAGRPLAGSDLRPAFVHTSLQRRALQTDTSLTATCARQFSGGYRLHNRT